MEPRNETRFFRGLEIRAGGEDAKHMSTIKGYGLKWSETINYGDMFRERFVKGAFAETLGKHDVKLLIGHNYEALPLARMDTGTMRVHENEWGLVFEADVDERDPEAASLAAKVRSGLADGMSIGFSMRGGSERIEQGKGGKDLDLHIIEKVGELMEISVVSFPAYSSSSVGMKRHMARTPEFLESQKPDPAPEKELDKLRVKSKIYAMMSRVGYPPILN